MRRNKKVAGKRRSEHKAKEVTVFTGTGVEYICSSSRSCRYNQVNTLLGTLGPADPAAPQEPSPH